MVPAVYLDGAFRAELDAFLARWAPAEEARQHEMKANLAYLLGLAIQTTADNERGRLLAAVEEAFTSPTVAPLKGKSAREAAERRG